MEYAIRNIYNGEKKSIIAKSIAMRNILEEAKRVSLSDTTVLVEGESGVGKEVIAKYIHQNSPKRSGPFVPVNCGAIPDSLFESELFGYSRGAFTNAFSAHVGYFEQAHNGTLFLDEISELPLNVQVKLLRILEDKVVYPLGSKKRIELNVRVIAASNQNLSIMVRNKTFRSDLYYRIAVLRIYIPPLRERKQDIIPFVELILKKHASKEAGLSAEAIDKLYSHNWPGNLRELESCVKRALIKSVEQNQIEAKAIVFDDHPHLDNRHILNQEQILGALISSGGEITSAAIKLGIHRNTVYNKLKKLGLVPELVRKQLKEDST